MKDCYVLQNERTKGYLAVAKDGKEFGFLFVESIDDAWEVPDKQLSDHYRDALIVLTGDKISIVKRS